VFWGPVDLDTRLQLSITITVQQLHLSIFKLKELSPPGKITVFTFVLCPHPTPPLDLLPWKMKKTQVYKSA
jgi:hypothetical protein